MPLNVGWSIESEYFISRIFESDTITFFVFLIRLSKSIRITFSGYLVKSSNETFIDFSQRCKLSLILLYLLGHLCFDEAYHALDHVLLKCTFQKGKLKNNF